MSDHWDDKDELWRNDPSKWILGVFYFNREDPRLFPPKRNPMMGWTLNFANRYAIPGILLIVLLAAAVTRF